MERLPHAERLAVSLFACSALVVVAGVVALLSQIGVEVASVLLTFAAMIAALGFGTARERRRRVDIALMALIGAALPLFGLFYVIGRSIFARLGQEVGGGLLLGIGVLLAITSTVYARRSRRLARS